MEIKTIRRKLKDVCSIKSSNIILNKIVKGDYPLFGAMGNVVEYINKFDNENFISIVKDGAGVGRLNFFEDKGSIIGTMDYIETKNNVDKKYLYYLLKTIKFDKYIIGSTIPHIYYKDWSKHEISFLIDINKQKMIGEFLSIFDKKINLIKKKILNKIEYKNKLINIFFNTLRAKENFLFSDIFKKYSQKNIENFKQYTIGKNGIKEFPDLRHKINNHNVFFKNDLIIGLGIEEVNINIDIEKGSCSPIYTIYSSNPKLLNINYGYYFIPFYLKKIKNSISKKSSRREFEIISFELNKIRIPLINNREQKIISDFLLNIDKEMEFLKKELILNIKHKKSILNKIFK